MSAIILTVQWCITSFGTGPHHLPARLGRFMALLDNAMQIASTSFRAYALDLFGFGDTMH